MVSRDHCAEKDTGYQVKGLIEDMIDRLTKEAAEEADAKAFCDTEASLSPRQGSEWRTESVSHQSQHHDGGKSNRSSSAR